MTETPVADLIRALAGSLEAHLEDCINLDLNDPQENAHYWAMCEEVALDVLATVNKGS
jgi:hypothetical protein